MTLLNVAKPIAYTIGEPAGIGADIILQLANDADLSDVVVVGDEAQIRARARRLGINSIDSIAIKHVPLSNPNVIAQPDKNNVAGVIAMLNTAIDGCKEGEFSAMVTGPLHKGVINDAGVAFTGHTEYLAQRTGAPMSVMMLATARLRVALVTTHLPLKDVSAAITDERIVNVCRIIDHDLRTKFGLRSPRQLVCGLNPHAGEGGHLGMEDA